MFRICKNGDSEIILKKLNMHNIINCKLKKFLRWNFERTVIVILIIIAIIESFFIRKFNINLITKKSSSFDTIDFLTKTLSTLIETLASGFVGIYVFRWKTKYKTKTEMQVKAIE